MSEEKKSKTNFLLGLFVGMAALSTIAFFTLLIVVFSNNQEVNLAANAEETQPAVEQPAAAGQPLPAVRDSEAFQGGEEAQVVLVEYTDFECPYCSRHHTTMNQVISEYGNKIKYVLRHFPLGFHPEAQKAAEAFECAAEQDKAFEMSDYIFEANVAKEMSVEKWKAGAKTLGLKTSQFNNCLDDGKYAAKVQQDASEGSASGVDGTPATFVNGQLVSGALPFESFSQIIDGLLK
jgi:protein-disulfide isomerase